MGGETIVQPRAALFTGLPAPTDPLAKFYGQDDHVLYGPYKSGKTFDFYRANLQRKYGPDYEAAWRKTTLARLKSWGFNTIGNWSDEALGAAHQVPYVGHAGRRRRPRPRRVRLGLLGQDARPLRPAVRAPTATPRSGTRRRG